MWQDITTNWVNLDWSNLKLLIPRILISALALAVAGLAILIVWVSGILLLTNYFLRNSIRRIGYGLLTTDIAGPGAPIAKNDL